MKITANMVTIARIVLLPIPAALLVWGNQVWVWVALVIGIALGATDAVDGYLARRDGPTVLGGLLDPVADKVFLAAFLLPMCAKGHCPPWVIGLVFARELLITALRSMMAVREKKLVTSKLGKIKTVVQMGGLGIYVFLLFFPEPFPKVLNGLGCVGLVITALVFVVRKKPVPFWIYPAFPLWGLIFGLTFVLPPVDVAFWLFVIMAAATWVSGADYLYGSARALLQTGLVRGDAGKVLWALSAAAAPALVGWHPLALFPAMIGLAGHLSLGGIDNIVTAETKKTESMGWWPLAFLSLLPLGASAWFFHASGPKLAVAATTSLYAAAALIATGVAFRRFKPLFFPEPQQEPAPA